MVTVRQRHYVVTEVAKSTFPDRPLKCSGSDPPHLITLSSVEDDGLGEELQFFWEIELGAKSSADVGSVQSPFRSGMVLGFSEEA